MSDTATPSVLVLGLGELGEEVVRSLAEHPLRKPTRLAVLLRSQKEHQLSKLAEWNVELVSGNVVEDSPETLAKIVSAFHTVICCVGMYAPPETQVKIARAVLAAGVRRYFPWQFGIDYDVIGRGSSQNLFDSQLDVRDLLRGQSATEWVIVSTGMFTSFIFEPAFDLVNAEWTRVTGIGSWENEITVTSPKDIGSVTAELALRHLDVQGVVFVSGDTISMTRLRDVVEKATGKTVTRKLKSVPVLKDELSREPSNAMRKYRVVFGEGVGVSWPKETSFNVVNKIPAETVEDWIAANSRS